MIAQNTIEITNAIDVGVAYLTRFFSNAGDVEKVFKNQQKKIVLIEFKNKNSIAKAFNFNGRILDKKPIMIKNFNTLFPLKQKQIEKKDKSKLSSQKLPTIKLPSFYELNKQQLQLTKRTSYRQVPNLDVEKDFTFLLDNNPFENINTKPQLWKTILQEMKKAITKNDQSQYQLILSISMGVWAFVQLKLYQIDYLMMHKLNMKSKYVENFIQEMVVNKLAFLTNDKLITNSNRFKVHQEPQGLMFPFNVTYPEQTEQEAQYFCQANDDVHKFLIAVYQHSHRLGKICHILHTNSLIVYEDRNILENLVRNFLVKSSQYLRSQNEQKNKSAEKIQNQQSVSNQESMISENKSESLSSFTGQIQNYGSCVFQNLTHNDLNSMVWLQNLPMKLEIDEDFPQFFTSSFIFDQCKGKSINESNFFNLYTVEEKQHTLQSKQSHTFGDLVIVFEQGQFSLTDLVENSLSFMRFKIRKQISHKQEGKLYKCKIQKYLSKNKFYSQKSIHSQKQLYPQGATMINETENKQKKVKISLDLDIFYVGIQSLQKLQEVKNSYLCLSNCSEKLLEKFHDSFQQFQVSMKFDLILIDMIPGKKHQFNAFKCENYLINHIDTHFIGKNTIIASQQFAEKVAEKVLEDTDKNELFGFKDKKYLGSQIWRLYNKSGARRAKMKISQYHFKRLKSE